MSSNLAEQQNQDLAPKDPSLPQAVSDRGITKEQWRTLMKSLYPGADSSSVLMVIDYCKSRKLDPMKKPCHIVPMRVKDARSGNYEWRDVVMPGVYELRTTAMRTGEYMGHSKPEYGEMIDHAGVTAPEYCELEIYRWHPGSQTRIAFPVRVYFRESVATDRNGTANQRWAKAPIQMLTKCAEAAGLREAFPDELGGEMSAEEMIDQAPINDSRAKPESSNGRAPREPYPDEKLKANADTFREMIGKGVKTPDGIIAFIENDYELTDDQKRQIHELGAIEGEVEVEEGAS